MTSESPTVTAVIATYNKSSTLRWAIESVLWQTFQDFELWVVGDCCTDNSAEVVASFKDLRVHWHNLPTNTGYQSEPHNEGIRRAMGRYIAYLNHDDLWLPNHLDVLVRAAEEGGADFVFTILEWILFWREPYADIPSFPDAPMPPEASVTMHRKSVVAEIGYWKHPSQTHAIPRVELFRKAQFMGKTFQLVPYLTVLKFGGTTGGYAEAGPQADYAERIRRDPDFAHRELAGLLARAYQELDRPPTPRRLRSQMAQTLRRMLVRWRIDPAQLRVWKRPGWHIRKWRQQHGLDPSE